MAKTPDQLANQMLNKPLTPQTYDEFITQLGRHPTDEEYRGWIKPKIAASYKEFMDSGYDRNHIRSELMDAYGYEDLVNEAMGGSADDDWFEEMKKTTPFPKGVFIDELSDWDKLKDYSKFLGDSLYPFLKSVAKYGNRE